jgi:hypothetical protein
MSLSGKVAEQLARVALYVLGQREHAVRLGEWHRSKFAGPREDVLEDEAMERLQMHEVIAALQVQRGELGKAKCARLGFPIGQRERVFEPSEVPQYVGARVDVGIGQRASRGRGQCCVPTRSGLPRRCATDWPAARSSAASPSWSVSSASSAQRSRISTTVVPGSSPSARTDPIASATACARESITAQSRISPAAGTSSAASLLASV